MAATPGGRNGPCANGVLRAVTERSRRVALIAAAAVLIAVAIGAAAWAARDAGVAAASDRPRTSGSPATSSLRIPEPDPALWTAAEWQPIGNPFAPAAPPGLRVDGLVDGGELIVGWGRFPAPGRNQFNDIGAVFVSPDGTSWRAVAIQHGVNRPSTSELGGVAVGGLGYLAYGSVCCEPEARAVWHSVDAETWTRLEIEGDLDTTRSYFTSGVGLDDGWLTAGTSLDGRRADIWRSDDGATWASVLHLEDEGPGARIADLAISADGVVAVGTVTGPDGTWDGAIWTSIDGRTWHRVGEDDPSLVGEGEAQLESVVVHAGGLFVTGTFGTTEDRRRCEELGMVASTDPRPPVAFSCAYGTPHSWLSGDDGAFVRIDQLSLRGEAPIEYRLAVPGGPGLVVLGESAGPGSPDTSLFVSADGVSWTAVDPQLPFGPGVAMGLVVRGRDLVAVTDTFDGAQSHIAFWLGRVE